MDKLQRENALSTQIFDALRSEHQVPAILGLLKGQADLSRVADIAKSPSATQSSVDQQVGRLEDVSQEADQTMGCNGTEAIKGGFSPNPSSLIHGWLTMSCDQLIKRLLSLYWTWIHPAYPLFNMECFVQDYRTGTHDYCSAFLVAAVCAAACDLISPPWINAIGKEVDIAILRQELVTEANMQENLADHAAQTTLVASQVMMIVEAQSVSADTTLTEARQPCRMEVNKQVLLTSKEQSSLNWLHAIDPP